MRREAAEVNLNDGGARGGNVVRPQRLRAQFADHANLFVVHENGGGAARVEHGIACALERGAYAELREQRLRDAFRVVEACRCGSVPARRAALPVRRIARARENDDRRLALVRQVAGARNEHAANLEAADGCRPMARCDSRAAQQRRAQRRPQTRLLLTHRIVDGERLAPVRQGGVLAAYERARDRLLQPERDERVPRLFAQRPLRLGDRAGDGALQWRALNGVVADDPRDFLYDVLFDMDVRPPVGRRDRHCAVRRVLDREAERVQRRPRLRFGEVRAEQAAQPCVGERNAWRGARAGEHVANALRGLAARRLHNEADGAAQRPLRKFRIQPLLKAQRGVRPQLERVRRSPRVDRVERRGLQQHVAGGRGHFGVRAAHHAREPYRALRIGDH